jgi:hypothetical protein
MIHEAVLTQDNSLESIITIFRISKLKSKFPFVNNLEMKIFRNIGDPIKLLLQTYCVEFNHHDELHTQWHRQWCHESRPPFTPEVWFQFSKGFSLHPPRLCKGRKTKKCRGVKHLTGAGKNGQGGVTKVESKKERKKTSKNSEDFKSSWSGESHSWGGGHIATFRHCTQNNIWHPSVNFITRKMLLPTSKAISISQRLQVSLKILQRLWHLSATLHTGISRE